MVHEEVLREFVAQLRASSGDNLTSVILFGSAAEGLFGSAAEGEFHPEYSDLNLLCIVEDTSFAALSRAADAVEWWRKKKHHPPILLTRQELKETADVFSIEFLDMKRRYRVLYGEDVLRDLIVPMHLHRAQLEYELREKLFLLRQQLLLAGAREKALWEIMLHTLSSFTTLFRHVLVELGEPERKHSQEAVEELASRLNFDPSPFVQLIEVRARRSARNQLRAADVAAGYISAIETVASAVDKIGSSPAAPG